tara:strand:- start:13 stop:306 length:294 start_codon:yes stop_codon:yes gene_type:complete
MANEIKIVNGVEVKLTNAEQKVFEDANLSWANDAPNRGIIELRRKRNELLAETDYMGNQDYSITDAWKTYRQALRDITSQTPNDDLLSNITFPKKPS